MSIEQIEINTTEYLVTLQDGSNLQTLEITEGVQLDVLLSEMGLQGPAGPAGKSISSVVKTSTVGLVDTYTITFSDSTTQTFAVTNGTNGVDGVNGRGIVSITRTSGTGAAGTTDTYTITYTDATTSTFSVYNGADGTGSVNSVAMSVPTGLSVTGSPITTSGTLTVTYSEGYSIPTTVKQGQWDTAYNWGDHASAGYLTNAAIGSTVQAYDADLTTIAALTGTSGLLKKTAANTWTLDTTAYTTNTGTVTSVGVSVPTGLSVSGSPVTNHGTIAITLASGYSIPTTAKQANWDAAYGWGNHASAGYSKLTLGSTAGAALAASGSAGSATTAAKSDHVHPFPTAANVGAEPAITKSTGFAKWNGSAWTFDNSTYLTSFTESDPTVPSHVKGITTTNVNNWNTAYGWGNHASAGYSTLALGTAAGSPLAASGAAGSATTAAKSDHVHPFPTAANVGAVAASGGTASGLTLDDGYTEEVFAVTGTTPALSPTNGSIQTWTLSGNATPTEGTWAAGQSITLMVDDGSAATITWTSLAVTWKTNGGTAPTLNTSGFTVVALWKVGSTIYGARVGDA